MFDYQSDRHCSKTYGEITPLRSSLITSQIDTAPKRRAQRGYGRRRLITSQIDTAPKLHDLAGFLVARLITSQIDTAPKRAVRLDGRYRV